MQSQLDFIQLQLWIVMGLFGLFVASNIICYRLNKNHRARSNDPELGEMWDKGEIDNVLLEAETILKERPYHLGALYHGAKAHIARQQYTQARVYLERIALTEPLLKDTYQTLLADIDSATGSS